MKKHRIFAFLLFILLISLCHGGKILFYMPMVSKSMKITFMPLVKELSNRGHEVTVLMPFPDKKPIPNVEYIINESKFEEVMGEFSKLALETRKQYEPFHKAIYMAIDSNDNALSQPKLQKYIQDKNTKFDLVLVSPFLANEVGYYLAHRFNASLVLYFTGQVSMITIDWAIGQPHNPSYLPMALTRYTVPMTFSQRVKNIAATAGLYLTMNYQILPEGEKLLEKHFPGEERPSLYDLQFNVSLVLSFEHPLIFDGNRPTNPNFVSIGMMNCRPGLPLPNDLKKFMDESKHGVIYVSFGSVLQASQMSDENRLLFVNVFKRFKQDFLWKWETEDMEDKPDNVKLMSWIPQQDILAHPNTKLFITHGGQSSCQEAICHRIPMVVVSIAEDQPINGKDAQQKGYAKWLPWQETNEESLYKSIDEVLNNPKYTEKAKEIGNLLTDQINKPLDRAVWWLEFLLRHPNENYYRSPSHDLHWIQYFLLDVIALFAFIFYSVCWIMNYLSDLVVEFIKRKFFKVSKNKKKN